MLAYIKGTLEMKYTGFVVIDVGGLGYKVFMSEPAIEKLGNLGNQVKVHTFYRVREDDISIYGFNTSEELRMFELLLSVSGIGAKTALAMLATISPSEFALAVISEDVSKITKIPGIGPKSAKRIVLELKDKLKAVQTEDEILEASSKMQEVIKDNEKLQEAISALQVLGYNRKEIDKAVEKLDIANLSVEDIIKKGLIALAM